MSAAKQFVAIWPNSHFVKWRGLTMREHQQFLRRLDFEPEMIVFCDLYQLVTIGSAPLEDTTAGIVDFLGKRLLHQSAFTGQIEVMQKALDQERAALQINYLESCKAVLAGVFRYTFEEIDGWDEATFFERLAKAELISGEDLGPKKIEEPKAPSGKPVNPRMQKKPLTHRQAAALERVQQSRSTA